MADIVIGWRSALIFAVSMPILATAIMLALRTEERRANLFLALLLVAVFIGQIPQIIGFSGFYNIWPGLTFFPFETELYLGPLIYLHAFSLVYSKPLGWRKALFMPGLAQTAYYTWAYLALGDYQSKWDYAARVHSPLIAPIEAVLAACLLIWSLWATTKLIRDYNDFLTATQSAKNQFDPIWLRRLLVALFIAGCLFIGLQAYEHLVSAITYRTGFPIQLLMALIVAWVGLEALSRTVLPFPKIYELDDSSKLLKDWEAEGQRLTDRVLAERWFLNSSLTLRGLANLMASNETYISRALNLGLGVNFNAFINSLRVNHAKQRIAQRDSVMLQIALDSGFNSKATFNRAFKEFTGQTPSQYRKSSQT